MDLLDEAQKKQTQQDPPPQDTATIPDLSALMEAQSTINTNASSIATDIAAGNDLPQTPEIQEAPAPESLWNPNPNPLPPTPPATDNNDLLQPQTASTEPLQPVPEPAEQWNNGPAMQVTSFASNDPVQNTPTSTPPQKKKSKIGFVVAGVLLLLLTLPVIGFFVNQQQQIADNRGRADCPSGQIFCGGCIQGCKPATMTCNRWIEQECQQQGCAGDGVFAGSQSCCPGLQLCGNGRCGTSCTAPQPQPTAPTTAPTTPACIGQGGSPTGITACCSGLTPQFVGGNLVCSPSSTTAPTSTTTPACIGQGGSPTGITACCSGLTPQFVGGNLVCSPSSVTSCKATGNSAPSCNGKAIGADNGSCTCQLSTLGGGDCLCRLKTTTVAPTSPTSGGGNNNPQTGCTITSPPNLVDGPITLSSNCPDIQLVRYESDAPRGSTSQSCIGTSTNPTYSTAIKGENYPTGVCGKCVQIDLTHNGQNWGSAKYTGDCATTPTTPPVTAQCQNIKLYRNNTLLTTNQYNTIKPGQQIVLAVVGVNAEKARFSVNNAAPIETAQRNNASEWILPYTVPTVTTATTFTIQAEIYGNGQWR